MTSVAEILKQMEREAAMAGCSFAASSAKIPATGFQISPPLTLCATLRQVQGARNRSSAHCKGRDFDEALLLDGAPDLPTLFETMLTSLATALEQLSSDLTASAAT